MLKQYKHGFIVSRSDQRKIDEVFSSFNITCKPKEYPFDSSLDYDFVLPGAWPNIDAFNEVLAELIPTISVIPMNSYQPYTYFIFDKKDFDDSPFLRLASTGNSSRAFIESKRLKVAKRFLCESCGVNTRELLFPLEIPSSKMGNRLMVNVNEEYWVITEKLAVLLDEWNLQGYRLEKVITDEAAHQKLYRLVPVVTLPPWSDAMEFLVFDRAGCCDLRNYVPIPFHYDASALQNVKTDFALTHELVVSGDLAYRPLMVSSKFRELIIKNKISKEIINLMDPDYKSFDWFFEPIVVVQK